jgi:hypothetical protein
MGSARAKMTSLRGMDAGELKVHRELLRAARDERRARFRALRFVGGPPPEPREPKIGRPPKYRIIFPMPVMPEGSNPSWAAEAVGERRLWCRRYDTCLSFAASQKWPGFDCGACGVREEEKPTLRTLGEQDEIREVWAAIRRRN